MRKLLFVLIALIPILAKAQMDTINFVYTRIDEIQGSKQELFIRARNFAFDLLKNPKAAIQINDSVSGKIMLHTSFQAAAKKFAGTIFVTINIDVKDNKCRFIASDYKFSLLTYDTKYDLSEPEFPGRVMLTRKSVLIENWKENKQGAISTTEDIYQVYKTYMNKNDNW